jgi:hypothetical protein
MNVKPGKYICISSTGITLNGDYLKLNKVIHLTATDLEKEEVQSFIKRNLLKFMGQEKPSSEVIESDSISLADDKPTEDIKIKKHKEKPHAEKN